MPQNLKYSPKFERGFLYQHVENRRTPLPTPENRKSKTTIWDQ